MDPAPRDLSILADVVREVACAVVDGAGTHAGIGGAVPADAARVRAAAGVVRHDPADLTVTVSGGTPVADLAAAVGAAGQEVVLDPRDPHATVGGLLAVGLSGPRRLRYGPLRDQLLQVRVVTGDGRVVVGGGPTVKNVTGYDLPRLFVGSLGTLGVIGEVTLRCRPRAARAGWFVAPSDRDPQAARRALLRPAAVLWDGRVVLVRLEGPAADVEAEAAAQGLVEVDEPALPEGPHRGRISVPPAALAALGPGLEATGARWMAEVGVGTVHVATDTEAALAAARVEAHGTGGWLLREAGAAGLHPFGRPLPNLGIIRRLKEAFDPEGKLAPGRLPL